MKNLTKSIRMSIFLLFILMIINPAYSQVKQITDPLLTHSNYISIDAGMNYIAPDYMYNYAVIENAKFDLANNINGAYQPVASLEAGHVFKVGKTNPYIVRVNTGVSIASYSVSMIPDYTSFQLYTSYNFVGNTYRMMTLSETFLQVPLAVSMHFPLQINQAQSRYHALELKFGGYYGMNIKREVQYDETYQLNESNNKNDYLLPAHQFGKFSLFAEAGVSFTAPNGHSHEIGIRATHDLGPYLNFNITSEELPFLYNTLGIFYRWTFYCF